MPLARVSHSLLYQGRERESWKLHCYTSTGIATVKMRMLLSVMVMVVVMVVVKSHLPPDSHLYDECVVKENPVITTFEDSIKFWFVRTSDEDLQIKFFLKVEDYIMEYGNLAQHEWLQAEVKLVGDPALYIQGRIQQRTYNRAHFGGRIEIPSTFLKNFTILNADVLLQCPQGWPIRELSTFVWPGVRIPSSGKEETLVLTSILDTKVKFSVSGNMRTLCWNTSGSGLAVVGEETESDCGDLRGNSPVTLKFLFEDHNVEVLDAEGRHLDNITYQGARDFKFHLNVPRGPVYIAQCIGSCTTGTAPANGEPADSTPWERLTLAHQRHHLLDCLNCLRCSQHCLLPLHHLQETLDEDSFVPRRQ
ncbi:uncharacterized protein [Procambarus clarkii]|uniref:uncharacterized protein isoform X2 n=1 Tax=Procambarus clarkii TaxID=6728 RepID=UPI0037430CB2